MSRERREHQVKMAMRKLHVQLRGKRPWQRTTQPRLMRAINIPMATRC